MNMYEKLLCSDGYWTLNKNIVHAWGVETALFLAELLDFKRYLENKEQLDPSGWFYRTQEDMLNRTSLTVYSQRRAINNLIKTGAIKTKIEGLPPKQYFNLELTEIALKNLLEGMDETQEKPISAKTPECTGENAGLIERKDNKELKDRPSTPSGMEFVRSKRTRFPKPKSTPIPPPVIPPRKVDQSLRYLRFAERLAAIIRTQKNVNITPSQVKSWSKPIHALATKILKTSDGLLKDDVIPRINAALDYYEKNVGIDQYMPVIECGNSFRDKFLKLENRMKREGWKPLTSFSPEQHSIPKQHQRGPRNDMIVTPGEDNRPGYTDEEFEKDWDFSHLWEET